ncbi:hypothetical protein NLJ89_g11449 [Agrocybe chaxingu]|uniref:Uncharacterized protein n=1 Tax=Agrocybe chaxingu TaxID=84603 RepID=A0A9W8JSC7_9AGAR|nr:hypothetical protein NLJ89_g11449 [Agrocybe chaxingu]
MELPQLSLDAYIALGLVIATPWLYRTFSPFSDQKSPKPTRELLLSTALLLHTLYALYKLLVSPPQSIFKALDVPVNIPPDYLRAKLVETLGGEAHVPQHLDTLLKRLGLMDLRSLYILFGHDALTTCTHCHSYNDFALYAFPGPLLEYIREIAFIGISTLPNSSTSYLRPLGLGALLASLLAEAYWTLTVQVVIPPFGSKASATMWHEIFVQLRRTLFLLLPLLITILPYLGLHRIPILGAFIPRPEQTAVPPTPVHPRQQSVIPQEATLNDVTGMTLKTLSHLVPTLHLLKYSHAAIMRVNLASMHAPRSGGRRKQARGPL